MVTIKTVLNCPDFSRRSSIGASEQSEGRLGRVLPITDRQ
jgi:hypothetical protein